MWPLNWHICTFYIKIFSLLWHINLNQADFWIMNCWKQTKNNNILFSIMNIWGFLWKIVQCLNVCVTVEYDCVWLVSPYYLFICCYSLSWTSSRAWSPRWALASQAWAWMTRRTSPSARRRLKVCSRWRRLSPRLRCSLEQVKLLSTSVTSVLQTSRCSPRPLLWPHALLPHSPPFIHSWPICPSPVIHFFLPFHVLTPSFQEPMHLLPIASRLELA